MTTETYTQRILIPDEGKYLYNAEARSISKKVYLGRGARKDEWAEITELEKETLEAQWEEKANTNG